MSFNKAKAVRAAEKNLSQGKIQAAIIEYRRIVEQDANDWQALNMLGDLYVRTGQPSEANGLYARVAEHYRGQGFALKAIAMYKKMLRLRPDDLAASVTLAELYAAQGLVVEARAQLLSIADAHTQGGRTRNALDILRRIADLDPHNPEVRLRVAAAYAREGFADEAAAAYAEAGDRFLHRQTPETALDSYHEALALCPLHHAALAGTLAAHTQLGTPDEAAELLEKACERDASDSALLELLLRAYLEAESPACGEATIERLVALRATEPAYQMALIEVARLYLKANDAEAAVRALTRAIEAALTMRRDAELLEILEEAATRNPEDLAALNLLARIYAWQSDEAMLVQTLERIAEVSAVSGNRNQEVESLLRLSELAPGNADYRERLRALDALPPQRETFEVPRSEEVPTFESFMLAGDAIASPVVSDSVSGFDIVETTRVETASEFDHASPAYDSGASFADLNDDLTDAASDSAAPLDHQEIEWGAPLETSVVNAEASGSDGAPREDERLSALVNAELESVDFYLAQGYTDVALDTLDMIERQYGACAAIEERRRRAGAHNPPAASVEPGDALIAAASPFDEAAFGDISLDEVAFAQPAFDRHTPAPPTENASLTFDEFTLDEITPAAERETVVAASVNVIAASETANAATDSTNEFDTGLAAIFDEFRTAVEDETPASVGDYETHYNLGIAYQEMGLLDEAVEEFQKAAGIAAPADGTPRYLQCCNMLGHCFMQKGLPRLAVMWFRKGVELPGHTEDEYQALRYELGAAYEAVGETDRAMTTFMEVYGVDVSYRGVANKLRELRSQVEVLG